MTKNTLNFAGYMQVVEETRKNKCRTCGCPWESHDHHGQKQCNNQFNGESSDPQWCECNTGWIPGDNLEYLEYLYEKKLGRKTSRKSSKNK
jgi:hypothetical protein